MLNFLRPVQDSSLRIMIPGDVEKGYNQRNNWSSCNESEEELAQHSPSTAGNRRKFKSYTVMQRSGFQHTEYVQILTHLCKAEIFISLLYGIHGISCPGFSQENAYQGTCHINVLSSLVGLFTGGMGLGAVHRFRWRTMLASWLIMCIISAVANLLAVITTGVWLDHLSKLKTRTGLANGLSGLLLLGSVLVELFSGVCFILTSVLICHYWASNSTRYQPIGRIAKKNRALRRRSSKAAGSGTERQHGGSQMHSGSRPGCSSTAAYRLDYATGSEQHSRQSSPNNNSNTTFPKQQII